MTRTFASLALVAAAAFGLTFAAHAQETPATKPADAKAVPAVLDFKMKSLAGDTVNLADYQGKVIVMVNTASRCGFTPQYKALEALNEQYKDKGLVVLGFPSNSFNQELATDSAVADFCEQNFGVKFPMFSVVSVKGEDQCPLYQYLTSKETNPASPGEVKWNFEKFIIGKDGKIAARFRSPTKPDSEEMMKVISAELAK